jgi:hypothetical protein
MTSDDKINGYIREALELIINDSKYLVIKADQNAPRKTLPYCTVKIMASRSSSWDDFSHKGINETETEITSKAMRSILVSFNFFKNDTEEHDPFYVAGLCRQALNRNTISSKLNSDGLGLATRSQVKNMTFELDNGFEERANFTATFNFVDTDSEIITTISTVEAEGEYHINGRVESLDINVNNN